MQKWQENTHPSQWYPTQGSIVQVQHRSYNHVCISLFPIFSLLGKTQSDLIVKPCRSTTGQKMAVFMRDHWTVLMSFQGRTTVMVMMMMMMTMILVMLGLEGIPCAYIG